MTWRVPRTRDAQSGPLFRSVTDMVQANPVKPWKQLTNRQESKLMAARGGGGGGGGGARVDRDGAVGEPPHPTKASATRQMVQRMQAVYDRKVESVLASDQIRRNWDESSN